MALATVRVIAYSAVTQPQNSMKVVNVRTTAAYSTDVDTKKCLQASAAPANNEFATVMASGAADPVNGQGLPNIYISGYSGPL